MSFNSGAIFHFRELRPKDFYYAQILRQRDKGYLPLIDRLLLNPEVLDETTASYTRAIFKWAVDVLLNENVLTVENWLEISYHLCKQRWDSSIDWLEMQPMSKIFTMIEIIKKHVDDQEKEMKRSR